MIRHTPPFRAFLPLEETLFNDGFTCPGTHDYCAGIAGSTEDRLAAYRLVYTEYAQKGFVPPNVDGLWYTPHDFLPHTTTFIVKKGDEVCSTVGLVADADLGLPCEEVFPEEVATLRSAGRRVVEVTSLASTIPSIRTGHQALLALIRLLKLTGRHLLHATDCLITVNPRHVEFYRKKLCFQVLAGPRDFGKVNGAPAVLLWLDLEMAPARYADAFGRSPESNYVHFYEPNRRQGNLLAWLRQQWRPQTAAEIDDLINHGLHHRLLREKPELLFLYSSLYPSLARTLSASLKNAHAAA